MKYKRILLKVSGGALSGKDCVFDKEALDKITDEIIEASKSGVEVAVLVGRRKYF